MSEFKLYCHCPVGALVQSYLSALHITNEAGADDGELSALVISPVEMNKPLKQIFPIFIKKLEKKFKSSLKASSTVEPRKLEWSWDEHEDQVILLECLEDFLSLKWRVDYFSNETMQNAHLLDQNSFKQPISSLLGNGSLQEDIYVTFKLISEPQDANLEEEFSKLDVSPRNRVQEESAVKELIVEEIDREATEQDKEKEKEMRLQEEQRLDEEFSKFKSNLEKQLELLKPENGENGQSQSRLSIAEVMSICQNVLKSISIARTNKREQAIYLTEKRIDVSMILGMIELENNHPLQTKNLIAPLIPIAKKGPVDTYVNLLLLLGDAEHALEDFEEAMKAYTMCLSVKKQFSKLEKMSLNAKRAKTAVKFEESDSIGYVNMTADEGFKYLKFVIENSKPGEPIYSFAAEAAAELMFKKGQIGQAAHTNLIALVGDASNKDLRKQFANFLQAQEQLVSAIMGMFTNIKQANEQDDHNSTASSFLFLGSVLKEHSAVVQAEIFFRKANELTDYSVPVYVLNYLHLLELKQDYTEFMSSVEKFLAISIKNDFDALKLEKYQIQWSKVQEVFLAAKDITETKKSSVVIKSSGYSLKTIDLNDKKFHVLQENGSPTELGAMVETLCNGEPLVLSETALQTVALLFTVVKMLFLIVPIPHKDFPKSKGRDLILQIMQLIEVLEPIRAISSELHLSAIKNEHAYYDLIAQLIPSLVEQRTALQAEIEMSEEFKDHEEKIKALKDKNIGVEAFVKPFVSSYDDNIEKLFIFGDSHALPLAWRLFKNSKWSEVIPVLSTGVKAWHLREESDFYPKYAFFEGVQFINKYLQRYKPNKAKVIFSFCEIDCREGMAISLERGIYASAEDAAKAIVDIYVSVLESLVKKHKFQIYVHPVLPILDASRENVNIFNRVLKESVSLIENDVKWLEFLPMLVDDQGKVKAKYNLDGTHVHPDYLELFQNQL